jgi:uncharacterized protein DUF2213
MNRYLKTNVTGYTARTETLDGEEYLVIPVVALVEGVVHASNASNPELVTLDAFKDSPVAFNGKPLFLGHPVDRHGSPVAGSQPGVIEHSIGYVFNTAVKAKKLMTEAWVNVKRALAQGDEGHDLVARIRAAQDIEVSVGIATDELEESGVYNGKQYADKWGPIAPDHLALLPAGVKGACSIEMGCGVRALIGNGSNQYTQSGGGAEVVAKSPRGQVEKYKEGGDNGRTRFRVRTKGGEAVSTHSNEREAHEALGNLGKGTYKKWAEEGAEDVKNMYAGWLEDGPETDQLLKTLRDIPQTDRDKMAEEDFAGPNRSFPIAEPEDVKAAAESLGRAKGNRASIKRKIIAIAYRKGDTFTAQLPDDWKKKSDQKAMSLFARFMQAFKGAQSPDQMSAGDLQSKLYQALAEKEAELVCVETYFPVSDPAHVVYTVREASGMIDPYGGYPLYNYVLYERSFELSDSGVVTLNDARIEVQPVMSYEPVEGASPVKAAEANKDIEDPVCSCHKTETAGSTVPAVPASQELNMKDATKKVLEALTPEQEDAIVAFAGQGFKAAEKVVEKEVVKEVTKEVPVEMTREQAIEKFGLGDAVKAAEAKKTASVATIKANKANTFTDAQLAAKDQSELDAILALAGTAVKAAGSVDFGGRGAGKEEAGNEAGVAPVASLDEKIKAARAAKK